MGTTITKEQNSSAAKAAAENLSARFGDAGVTSEVVAHSAGKSSISLESHAHLNNGERLLSI